MGAVKKLAFILVILAIILFGMVFLRNTLASLDSALGFEENFIPPEGQTNDNQPQQDTGNNNGSETQEATEAYQEYIAAYNKLTDLMSQGKGDTPEAQQAYQEYKEAKENYEQIAKTLK